MRHLELGLPRLRMAGYGPPNVQSAKRSSRLLGGGAMGCAAASHAFATDHTPVMKPNHRIDYANINYAALTEGRPAFMGHDRLLLCWSSFFPKLSSFYVVACRSRAARRESDSPYTTGRTVQMLVGPGCRARP